VNLLKYLVTDTPTSKHQAKIKEMVTPLFGGNRACLRMFTVGWKISFLIFTNKESVLLQRGVTCPRSIHTSAGGTKTESVFEFSFY